MHPIFVRSSIASRLRVGCRDLAQVLGFFLFLAVTPSVARAQWLTQSIVLQPGWNAVYLEVQPEPRDCDSVFAGLPIESVWGWNRRQTTARFIDDVNQLLPGQPDWLSYFPAANGDTSLTSLFAVHAGRCYLIKYTGTNSTTWNLKGHPVVSPHPWIAGSLNFVGFPFDPVKPPTFGTFFAPSPAHTNQPIFRLGTNGLWLKVANPATTAMKSGEAFWIYTSQPSTYSGPMVTTLEQSSGVNFGRTVPETVVLLKNVSSSTNTVTINPKSSENPPVSSSVGLAGSVPLSYWNMKLASNIYGWSPINSPVSVTLAPGQQLRLRLALQRANLQTYQAVAGIPSYDYQSLLELTDGAGSRLELPVTAYASGAIASQNQRRRFQITSSTTDPHAGLWVGSVLLNQVSQPSGANPTHPTPASSQAQFRLIVHVDASGQARLLQQVTLMWTNGVTDSGGNLVVPGHRVLITDDALLSQYSGSTLVDGKQVGRRISTVAFGISTNLPMLGPFGDTNNALGCTLTLDYRDPLNPFVHRFHPDHDNLDEQHATVLPEGLESFTITRLLNLQFTPSDPMGIATAQWGGEEWGGNYLETITGLHKTPLVVAGTFRLNRVSLVDVLNDGN